MNRLIVICGPTATGKTKLGLKLAKKFDGEIVSADSRQVYKGMDIGTGKEIGNVKFQMSNVKSISNDEFQIGYYEIGGAKVWLYDVVEPDYRFSVADYVKCANLVLRDIIKRRKLPILVGGTGFYIKAIIDGIETVGIPPDWKLRKKFSNFQIAELSRLLRKLDPNRWRKMNESDKHNSRRLIRAIEIAVWKLEVGYGRLDTDVGSEKKRRSYLSLQYLASNFQRPTSILLLVGLTAPYKILYQRIDERVEKRVKEGVVEEIESLVKNGYSFKNSVLGETIGYKEFEPYLEGKIDLFEAIQKWKYDEHAYARKQMTWFKKALRQAQGVWFDVTMKGFERKVEERIKKYLGSE